MAFLLPWKRKHTVLQSNAAAIFQNAEEENEDASEAVSSQSNALLRVEECNELRGKQLSEEAVVLAEQGRYWCAVRRFDAAISCSAKEARFYEMKAQVLMELERFDDALEVAYQAVHLNRLWAEALQTLGRCQISCGDIEEALRSFSKACHLKPTLEGIFLEDIHWAQRLLREGNLLKESAMETSD